MGAEVTTEGGNRRLSNLVAVTVVILSVFMTISKIKDDNINHGFLGLNLRSEWIASMLGT